MGRSGSGKSNAPALFNQLDRHDEGTLEMEDIRIPAGLPLREWKRLRGPAAAPDRMGSRFQLFPHGRDSTRGRLARAWCAAIAAAAAEATARSSWTWCAWAPPPTAYPARLSGRRSPARRDRARPGDGARGAVADEPTSALDPDSTRDVSR